MDYKFIYNSLIQNRILNELTTGYYERHHILPRALGGSDDRDNIVNLTGREHYVAHLLLHKIYKQKETAFALWMMRLKSKEHDGRPHIKNSRMYEWARKEFAKYISKNNSKMKGKLNSQFGKMWICNLELKENKVIYKEEEVPEGWVRGRNRWKRVSNCPTCGKSFVKTSDCKKYCSSKCRPSLVGLNKGMKFTESHKSKISNSKKKLYEDPTRNPSYGKTYKWINNGKRMKKLYDNKIPSGWIMGYLK